MRCTKCRSHTAVYRTVTITKGGRILRYRECLRCGARMKTIERVVGDDITPKSALGAS